MGDDFDPFEVFDWKKQPWRWSTTEQVTTRATRHPLAWFEVRLTVGDVRRARLPRWVKDAYFKNRGRRHGSGR